MSRAQFSKEPHYIESVRGLLQLHELEVRGESETPRAEAIRDALEGSWWFLADVERQRITGLSEDLHSISALKPAKGMTPVAQRKLVEAMERRKEELWDEALEILRRWGDHFDPALCSYLRGTIWMEAGDHATAAVFFEHAADLDEDCSDYREVYLHNQKCLGTV